MPGSLDRFGFVDPTNGGDSHRYSLSASTWRRPLGAGVRGERLRARLPTRPVLNFTYALDPDNGDQFEQFDDRKAYGVHAEISREPDTAACRAAEVRPRIPLRRHRQGGPVPHRRPRRASPPSARIGATPGPGLLRRAAAAAHRLAARDRGLRHDRADFDVRSDLAANSGRPTTASPAPNFLSCSVPGRDRNSS